MKNLVYIYQTLLKDHLAREATVLDRRPILRMRVKKAELPQSELLFEWKACSYKKYDAWVKKILAIPRVSVRMTKVGVNHQETFQSRVSRFKMECRESLSVEGLLALWRMLWSLYPWQYMKKECHGRNPWWKWCWEAGITKLCLDYLEVIWQSSICLVQCFFDEREGNHRRLIIGA